MKNLILQLLFIVCFSYLANAQDIPGPLNTNSFADLNAKRTQLNLEIPRLEKRLAELGYKGDSTSIISFIFETEKNLKYFEKQVKDIRSHPDTAGLGNAEYGVDYYTDQLDRLKNDLRISKTSGQEMVILEKEINDKRNELLKVENEISNLMIPQINKQNLMFWSEIGFVLLMCILLATFWSVIKSDPQIRRIIFGGDSGIQFIALFSIIIAIILLGLTGILEGKELSALLGSVAGYILGKVKFTSANPNLPGGQNQGI